MPIMNIKRIEFEKNHFSENFHIKSSWIILRFHETDTVILVQHLRNTLGIFCESISKILDLRFSLDILTRRIHSSRLKCLWEKKRLWELWRVRRQRSFVLIILRILFGEKMLCFLLRLVFGYLLKIFFLSRSRVCWFFLEGIRIEKDFSLTKAHIVSSLVYQVFTLN